MNPPQLIRCLACGHPISIEAHACPACGKPTHVGRAQHVRILGIVFLVLSAIGTAYYFWSLSADGVHP